MRNFKAAKRTFIRDDLQLTKDQGQSLARTVHTAEIYGEDVIVSLLINRCSGCKKCLVNDCNYGLNNYAKFKECPNHKADIKELRKVGVDCPVSFVYVYPADENNKHQWFGMCES